MSPIIVHRLSPRALAFLERRAAVKGKTVADELSEVVEEAASGLRITWRDDSPWTPDVIPSEEVSVPSMHPWPGPTFPVRVTISGDPRLPDPGSIPDA
jgi:hypothetical protein